jgi:hypothetical protein
VAAAGSAGGRLNTDGLGAGSGWRGSGRLNTDWPGAGSGWRGSGRLNTDWPGAGSGWRGWGRLNTDGLGAGSGWRGSGRLNTDGPGAGWLGGGELNSDLLGSGQLDGERPMTGVGSVGGWRVGGAAPACRSATRLVRKSRPQDSQNWPDRAVPQVGHGSFSWSGVPVGGPGGRAGPADGAVSGQGAGAGTDSRIRIPHVSQKSVLSDS